MPISSTCRQRELGISFGDAGKTDEERSSHAVCVADSGCCYVSCRIYGVVGGNFLRDYEFISVFVERNTVETFDSRFFCSFVR